MGAALCLLVASALSACGESPRELRWKLALDPGVARERIVGYQAAILPGSCASLGGRLALPDQGQALYWEYAHVADGRFSREPDELAPGAYAFWAAARDAQCNYIATGCVDESLPLDDGAVVRVTLAGSADEPACAGERCVDGECAEEPVPDAGLDAGVGGDAGPDAGFDAGLDAGADSGTDGGGGCGSHERDCAGTGECISLLTLTDCGDCDTPCALPHGGESCASGGCEVDGCDDGWEDCDSVPSNGCEEAMSTLASCGGCYEPCSLSGAAEDCVDGVCVLLSCMANRDNCDDVDSNGCEANLWEDSQHCGNCLTVCTAGDVCQKGVCGPPD